MLSSSFFLTFPKNGLSLIFLVIRNVTGIRRCLKILFIDKFSPIRSSKKLSTWIRNYYSMKITFIIFFFLSFTYSNTISSALWSRNEQEDCENFVFLPFWTKANVKLCDISPAFYAMICYRNICRGASDNFWGGVENDWKKINFN